MFTLTSSMLLCLVFTNIGLAIWIYSGVTGYEFHYGTWLYHGISVHLCQLIIPFGFLGSFYYRHFQNRCCKKHVQRRNYNRIDLIKWRLFLQQVGSQHLAVHSLISPIQMLLRLWKEHPMKLHKYDATINFSLLNLTLHISITFCAVLTCRLLQVSWFVIITNVGPTLFCTLVRG